MATVICSKCGKEVDEFIHHSYMCRECYNIHIQMIEHISSYKPRNSFEKYNNYKSNHPDYSLFHGLHYNHDLM